MKRWVSPVILLLLLLGLLAFRYCQSQKAGAVPPGTTPPKPPTKDRTTTRQADKAPAYVLKVLDYVRKNGHAPEDYVGGREFKNREKRLPKEDAQGRPMRYSEWDVHPKRSGRDRGPERLITGSDHHAWYTADHYQTFQKID